MNTPDSEDSSDAATLEKSCVSCVAIVCSIYMTDCCAFAKRSATLETACCSGVR